jgi:hypothetical protein
MFTKAVEWEMVGEETLKKIRKVKQLSENNQIPPDLVVNL